MSNSIENLVCVEVEDRMNKMAGLKTTDEAYKATADVTLKLIDRATKIRELEIQEEANKLKKKEIEEAKKRHVTDSIIKGFEIAGKIIVPAALAIGLTIYEQTEVTTSTAVKEFWKKVFKI